ncbi:hypothetical protein [Burkholderia pseudomallei]|uniref:hypothetical protein n=1 Tax=Burkholderia pseudomallei TaxID=28450 RepID=UPI000E5B52A9|nr:hypothetical protein [Burkholderia pseudomallei]QGS82535.1 hypothetical protein PMC2000_29380 [Burkholderia pseudomallei]VUD64318.1 unnamed protein product [Burkholderia pseudomallei]
MIDFTDKEILAICDRVQAELTEGGKIALGYELDVAFGRAIAEAALEKAAPEPVRHVTIAGARDE